LGRDAGQHQGSFRSEVRAARIRERGVLVRENNDCGVNVRVGRKSFFDGALICRGGVGCVREWHLAHRERRVEEAEEFGEPAFVLWSPRGRDPVAEVIEERLCGALRATRIVGVRLGKVSLLNGPYCLIPFHGYGLALVRAGLK
jgi:hypothetical protein